MLTTARRLPAQLTQAPSRCVPVGRPPRVQTGKLRPSGVPSTCPEFPVAGQLWGRASNPGQPGFRARGRLPAQSPPVRLGLQVAAAPHGAPGRSRRSPRRSSSSWDVQPERGQAGDSLLLSDLDALALCLCGTEMEMGWAEKPSQLLPYVLLTLGLIEGFCH